MLGPFEVTVAGRPVALGAGKARLLLALLLAAANRPVSDDRLVDGLWPDGPPPSARKNLQVYVHQLRGALDDPGRIARHDLGYALTAAEDEVDAQRFEALLARADQAETPSRKRALLGEALSLWRGDAYAGHGDAAWLRDESVRLDELRLKALEERAELELAAGGHRRLVPELRALARAHPFREGLTAQLMLALYRSGRQAEALEIYQDARTALADELGLDPSPRLGDLHQAVLTGDPRLDLPAPVREAPPWHGPRCPVEELVGQRPEREALAALLASPRLVTVTGPGGVGKTTLALRAAADLAERRGAEVAVMALAGLSEGDDLVGELASLLELGGNDTDPAGAVQRHLRGRRDVLLVLDNCEHLVQACARLVGWLRPACPDLRILTTSRRPLGVPGETVRPLEPLPVPTGDSDATPAVELFLRRAREAAPDLDIASAPDAVARICRAVGGLPLALELAAARLRAFGPSELAGHLEGDLGLLSVRSGGADPRHRTLEATIGWSYGLLDATERLLLSRLSVFRDGFTAHAAAEVCGDPPLDRRKVPALLASLADGSLVQPSQETARFRLLETVHDYARDRLASQDDPADDSQDDPVDVLRDRHLAYWLERVRRIHALPDHDEQLEALRALSREVGNLRAALFHGHQAGRATQAAEQAAAQAAELTVLLDRFWNIGAAHLTDFERWVRQVLGSVPPSASGLPRAITHSWRGEFAAASALLTGGPGRRNPASAVTLLALECLFRTTNPRALAEYPAVLDRLAPEDQPEGLTRTASRLLEWGRPDLAAPLLDRHDALTTPGPAMPRHLAIWSRCLLAIRQGDTTGTGRWESRVLDGRAVPAALRHRFARISALRLLADGNPGAVRRLLQDSVEELGAAFPGRYGATFVLRGLLAEALRRLGDPGRARRELGRALDEARPASDYLFALPLAVTAALTAADLGDDQAARSLAAAWQAVRVPAGLAAPLGLEDQVRDTLGIDPAPTPPALLHTWSEEPLRALLEQARGWTQAPDEPVPFTTVASVQNE
ncbi:AfsR/SARP family transcriptional regulator [Actinomadura rupiterrae]|uniref:AfsR/SARP family transcriptional regulator n=1 Tax=Actinomadura rupiterrae TaxID=559627 RepID=UPI0020A2AB5F|nr:BTAD domain-containing putative transcriptional regulator [Actinomadura rupiterrae]MCP2342495.1 putative ATPase/DNA-binding SARP family transcriptional activator [Actinomadura rupiterrae]